MKVLVLTCNTGGGHNACAKYIKEEFNSKGIECDIKNYMDLAGKHASDIAEKLYLDSTKGNGGVFKEVYKLGELYSKTNLKSPVYGLNKLVKNKLYNYIIDNGYDMVLATHLFPCLALTALKKEHDIKFVNVATDYECIPFWEETDPDLFIIPSELLKERFVIKGIKPEVLLATGIPVASNFKKVNKVSLPEDKCVILIVSGSMGFGNLEKLITNLLKEIDNCYFLVITGNNKKMEESLKKIDNPNLIVKGFTKNINDYMAASSIVITKPGGLTTTEVATLHKPLVHMMPIPGVENYNAKFFSDNKMSIMANNEEEVVAALKKLLNNKGIQDEMVNNQKKIINENSALDLVEYIIKNY